MNSRNCKLLGKILGLCFTLLSLNVSAYEYRQLSNEFPINCITYSARHGIYLGSDNTVLYLNQNKIREIPLGKGFRITALLEYKDDLYIGTDNGDLLVVNLYSFKRSTIGKIEHGINKIFYDPKQKLLLLGTLGGGVAKLEKHKIHFVRNAKFSVVFDLISFFNQTMMATDAGLYILENDKIIPHKLNHSLADKVITHLAIQNDTLFLGSQLGYLFLQQPNEMKILLSPKEISLSNQIRGLAFFDNNIFIVKTNGWHIYNRDYKILESNVTQEQSTGLLIAENTCWVVGHSFINKFTTQINKTIAPKFINPIQQLHCGRLHKYVANHGKIYSTDNFIQFKLLIDFDDDISSIYESPDENLWVGTINKGIYLRKKGDSQFKKVALSGTNAANVVINIGGKGQTVWISTLDGIWISREPNNLLFESVKHPATKKIIYAYNIFQTRDKQFVISTDRDGVLILDSNFREVRNFHLDRKSIYTTQEDGKGNLWVLTSDDGIYSFRKKEIIHLNDNNGLYSMTNNAMLLIDDTTLAIVSSHGVNLLHTGKFWVDNIRFEKKQSLGINTAAYCDGQLVIAGSEGLISVSLQNESRYSLPQAHIEKVMMLNNIVTPNSTFDADENTFSFWVDVITNQERTIYSRYKIKGLSDQWRSTSDVQITFPKLPPGDYQFIYQASFNKSFKNNTSTTFSFKINSPVWKRWWFIVLCGTLVLLLLLGLQKVREKRIKRISDLQKEKVITEYENLKNQVNPHFLFNNFNTLISLIYDNKEKAIEYTEKLSTFYRSLIEDEKQLTHLNKEIELLHNYFYLQRIRMGEAIQLQVDISENDAQELLIPSLTLQLLCENAIKHNAASENNPLRIILQKDNEFLYVINNLNPKLNKPSGLGLGLENIKNRYKPLTQENVIVQCLEGQFIVKLPLLKP